MTTLQQEIKDLYKDLRELEWKAKTIKQIIQEKQDKLQSTCDHEWERDWGDYDHKTHYICKKCNLYR
jgi:hypothetical protein